MKIKPLVTESVFVKSSADWRDCPHDNRPEIAFIGRSNVGKSSLINMLTERRKLAKISVKPGKTRLINHFLINGVWYLVDLPGYGWAKVSKTEKAKWEVMIHSYLLKREALSLVFVLVDSRHEPLKSDLEMIDFLGENGIPLGIIFTKSDKNGITKANKNVAIYRKRLKERWETLPPLFISSAKENTGREEILNYILQSCIKVD